LEQSYINNKRMESLNEVEPLDLSLYNWLFHYNSYDSNWYAFTREDHNDYFNKSTCFTIKSKNISVLVKILKRAKGKKEEIQSVIY
jgi:hypothetical protein